jgi:aspartate/methionine/tyrosine aminotransferase
MCRKSLYSSTGEDMNPQAEELNAVIKADNPVIYNMLSRKGKEIYFPKKGLMSQSADAKGKKINATIGMASEEDGTPMRLDSLADLVNMAPGKVFPYSTSYGDPELRKIWAEMIRQKNPSMAGKKFSSPVVTIALTHGLSVAAYLFVEEGDTIIVPDLYWENYDLLFSLAYGARFEHFPLFNNQEGFNVEGLRKALLSTGEKKILVLNFPNNPTGFSISDTEMKGIVNAISEAAAQGKKVIVIIDDAYFGLFYEEGIAVESIFAPLADLHENVLAIKLDGATKEDYVWGFRVGFISFASKGISDRTLKVLEEKAGGAIRGNISNASHLSQNLLLEAYKSPSYAEEKRIKSELLKARYNIVKRVLAENRNYEDHFHAIPYNSGYFMCIRLKKVNAEKVRQILLSKYDTGIIAFEGILRVAYSALSLAQIPVLFENIYKACNDAAKEV